MVGLCKCLTIQADAEPKIVQYLLSSAKVFQVQLKPIKGY